MKNKITWVFLYRWLQMIFHARYLGSREMPNINICIMQFFETAHRLWSCCLQVSRFSDFYFDLSYRYIQFLSFSSRFQFSFLSLFFSSLSLHIIICFCLRFFFKVFVFAITACYSFLRFWVCLIFVYRWLIHINCNSNTRRISKSVDLFREDFT